jgi:hypothetical protein
MNGSLALSSHQTRAAPTITATTGIQISAGEMFCRNTSRASMETVKNTIPSQSMCGCWSLGGSRPVLFGKKIKPRITLATPSGRFTPMVALHPQPPTSSPPTVGPTTETVCVVTERVVRMAAGELSPVRSASARIMCMAAG